MKKCCLILLSFLLLKHIAIAQADLTVVGTVSVVCPNPVHVGITVNVTFSVQNIGSTAAGRSHTRIYLQGPAPLTEILISEISLESLAANATSNNIQFNFPVPYTISTGGTYYVIVRLNDDGIVTESNYSNNSANASITIDQNPWAAQNIPYPVIFIHGLVGANTTWNELIDSLRRFYGWSYGGNMNFCLNYDANVSTSNKNNDYHDFTDISSLRSDDYYTVNFDVNYNGVPYTNSIINESNQSAIVKQGLAIRDAIMHVLNITGKDKVILVGHSMGGLAAREYLQNKSIWQDPNIDHHVAKLVTVGTPHGGSNATDFGATLSLVVDLRSEAIRDLRTGYWYSYFWPFGAPDPNNDAPGAYLFGGVENLDYMRDQYLFQFYNPDVNCDNDVTGQPVVGINNKPISTDLSYSCLIGTGQAFPINGDGLVTEYSANINNFLPVNAATFYLPKAPGVLMWHTELTKQFAEIMKGMDEPNINDHAYKIAPGQLYYGSTTYQTVTDPPRDFDYYKIHVSSNGNLNVQVYNITTSVLSLDIRNSSDNSVYSINSNGKSYLNITTALVPGDYYIVLGGIPTTTSYKYPYSFKYTFTAQSTYCTGTTALSAPSGTISDGSGANNYNNNSDCRWKIQPSGATSITLSFSAFAVIDPGDTLYVYDGGTTTSPLLLAWTGSGLPANVTSTGGIMLIRFSSDASNTGAGWTADYTSVTVPTYCNGLTTLTSATGSFSDGSGNINYGNNSYCSWLINPSGAYSVTLTFTQFNTEAANDIVNIYDGNDNSATLLGTFSGNSLPSPLTSTGGALFVEFITGDTITASGWNASYTSYIPYSGSGIIRYEYWFDNNFMNAVSVPVVLQNPFQFSPAISANNLASGLHSFNMRFKDNSNRWSSIATAFMYKPNTTYPAGSSKYEYWFDSNYAGKTTSSISSSNNLYLIDSFNTTALATGLHTFNIRFKPDSKHWSTTVTSFFYKPDLAVAGTAQYEYWFDTAYANKTLINNVSTTNFILLDNIVAASLGNGLHTLHFRFKPDGKTWSSVTSSFFYKDNDVITGINNLARYVYWFDDNWQNPQTIIITGAQDINWTLNTNVEQLSTGPHTLSQAFKDDRGRWSSIVRSNFTKEPVTSPLCLYRNRQFVSGIIAGNSTAYQWQEDTGSGFTNISDGPVYTGTTTDTLHLNNVPTAWYGHKYRCIVTNGANTITGDTIVLKFAMIWNGSADNAWENPANWNCNATPDANTDVYINSGLARYPQVNTNVFCRKLLLQPGTSLEVKTGNKLETTGKD